jgi:hypothetical protein
MMIRQKKVSVPCTAGVTNRVYRGAVPSAVRLDEKTEDDVRVAGSPTGAACALTTDRASAGAGVGR